MILNVSFSIIVTSLATALAQNCNLISGKEGYCRQKDDCWHLSDGDGGCENGFSCCQTSKKSVEKCKDYGELVYKEAYVGALTARALIHRISECSIEAVPLVVGGAEAKDKEFPHMVAVGYGKKIEDVTWMCGGSLISENFVLTAAHCSESRERGPAKFARIGTINLKNPELNNQDFTIVEWINHPKYKPPSRYHDIALFKLSTSVKADAHSRPACLQVTPDEFAFKKATATGWGKLDYSDSKGSSNLMKVALSLIDYAKCNATYSTSSGRKQLPRGIGLWQLCAGELSGGKDTCQGDSGGPLQVVKDDPKCMYSIIGVTSFGIFCGFKNSPAVYTRVSYYVPWIESIVWP